MCLGLRSSLTVSPQAITERPSAKILKPSTNRLTTAFSSRWWSVWQFGHCQRSCNLSSTFLTWQMQHNFDDGKNVIRNYPRKAAILEHVLGAERLNNNHLVLMNELSAQLLKKVCSNIRYPLVNLGNSNATLLSVLRALGTAAVMFLCCAES